MRPPPLARRLLIVALSLALARSVAGQGAPGPGQPPGPTCPVVRVVDGDTLVVKLEGRQTTIRLAGVDTPETVAPGRPVERYGREATAFLRELVERKSVRLEFESGMPRTDRYGQTLAFAFTVPEGRPVNLAIVEGGYGHAYTAQPFAQLDRFRRAEREAREAGRGLWGSGPTAVPAKPGGKQGAEGQGAATVFVADTGSKYHREGCRYVAKSSTPWELGKLPAK